MLRFLNASGYKQQFDVVEQELRDSLMLLSGNLNIAQFSSQVRRERSLYVTVTSNAARYTSGWLQHMVCKMEKGMVPRHLEHAYSACFE
jgi:hypothetical protein